MKGAKIGIISCVPEGIFRNVNAEMFSATELSSAKKEELRVFLDILDREYEEALSEQGVQFDIIRAIEAIPKEKSHDAYIIGGSPNMVTENLPWINDLKTFINKQVNQETPVLGICFGHQILASSFGSNVDYMPGRKLGTGSVLLNVKGQGDDIFGNVEKSLDTLWSHRQAVLQPSEDLTILGFAEHDSNAVIKVGDHARGVQFHPEFSTDFVQFLRKIMDGTLRNEGINPDDIAVQLKSMANNQGSKVVQLFLKKYRNK